MPTCENYLHIDRNCTTTNIIWAQNANLMTDHYAYYILTKIHVIKQQGVMRVFIYAILPRSSVTPQRMSKTMLLSLSGHQTVTQTQ